MTPIRILAPALLTFAIISCASDKADKYDTADPYGTADASQVNAPVTPANPVYDTPAAYEESGTAAVTSDVNVPTAPTAPSVATPGVPAAPSNGAAIIHTVVAGDTLSGISAKYKVPSATIKQANGMTKDTVVLGKKMVILPVR
ncbi:MAG: LysM peptidoglycan-binding domain-containing protein [Verrucomicrobiota bacterium]